MVGAVDIGGTKTAVGIVDPEGKVVSRFESATQADGPYESALDRMVAMLRAAVASAGAKLRGIGIGSTGPVNPFTPQHLLQPSVCANKDPSKRAAARTSRSGRHVHPR